MRFQHRDHPERTVHLAYGLNLHRAGDLAETLAGLQSITLPLRERLAPGRAFGIGLYLCGSFARALASGRAEADRARLTGFLADHGLDPFTANAFPYERFHADGLKENVFSPTWREPARLSYTVAVARVLARAWLAANRSGGGGHLSISTHTGMFGAHVRSPRDLDECAVHLAHAVDELARIEEETGLWIVLALEPEPRANAQDSGELLAFLGRAAAIGGRVLEEEKNRERKHAQALLARHLGHCLDACHAAVEGLEAPLRELTRAGVVMGKLQYTSAVCVEHPSRNPSGLAALLALAEPRYLHQVTGHGARPMRATDLPELAAALGGPARESWLACERIVCHFHVPVDLETAGEGLTTTRTYADRLLAGVLADPSRWTTRDLHVEIETYTWDLLAPRVRGEGELVDGLEREYRHVIALLERAGWRHAG